MGFDFKLFLLMFCNWSSQRIKTKERITKIENANNKPDKVDFLS